jgi:hypothetical protein
VLESDGAELVDVESRLSEITTVVAGSLEDVGRTIRRCKLAGLLVDGGISQIADQWLSAHIGKQLGIKSVKPKSVKEPAKESST